MVVDILNTFITVAKEGSFNKAARELFTTVPSIMSQINSLEESLKLKLLIRSNHGVRLTEAGKVFLKGAQKTVEAWEQTIVNTKLSNSTADVKTLRIGISPLFSSDDVLRDFLFHFKSYEMFTPFLVQIGDITDSRDDLNKMFSQADMIICPLDSEYLMKNCETFITGYSRIGLAVPYTNPLSQKMKCL